MSYATNAYAKRAHEAPVSQRELEAQVLMSSAARLQGIRDNWDDKRGELDAALLINRKIWTVLAGAVADEKSPLPLQVKQNILQIAIFIFNHTIEITAQRDPDPAKLTSLININHQIALGLRSQPNPPAAPEAA